MGIQWQHMFGFGVSPWELVIRGTLMYWFIFGLLRLAGRRDIGSFGAADVLLLVLIADAAQNGMAANYDSVSEGAVLVGTLVFWSAAVDRLCFFFPAVNRLLEPSRICLVKDGKLQRRGMRQEFVTRDELMAELRQQGVFELSQVYRAYMEASGTVSILLYEEASPKRPGPKLND
jgi:uncharacterized membrane protein YcaP (DUF421 family)